MIMMRGGCVVLHIKYKLFRIPNNKNNTSLSQDNSLNNVSTPIAKHLFIVNRLFNHIYLFQSHEKQGLREDSIMVCTMEHNEMPLMTTGWYAPENGHFSDCETIYSKW